MTDQVRISLAAEPTIACTMDGGLGALRDRVTEWAAVLDGARSREPIEGGVALTFDHDAALVAELGRLAGAEYTCCSFFTFALTVGPPGVRLAVTAPAEGQAFLHTLVGAP
jgi:hypothetical protein